MSLLTTETEDKKKQDVPCREWVPFCYIFALGTSVNASYFQKLGFN